jgi:subtilisin family serine protease
VAPDNQILMVKIPNISLGGGGTNKLNCDKDFLVEKVNWAVDNGITVVSTKGNIPGKVSGPVYTLKVIGAGAVDENDKKANFSESELTLDIVVLGVSIYLTVPQNSYGFLSGTSMTTPHVAGDCSFVIRLGEQ